MLRVQLHYLGMVGVQEIGKPHYDSTVARGYDSTVARGLLRGR